MQQAKESDRENHEAQMQALRNEAQETKERLQSENTLLSKFRKSSILAPVYNVMCASNVGDYVISSVKALV